MLFSILSGGDIREIIIDLLLMIPIIIMSLSIHEAAHGLVAKWMGDKTAYNLGRVTLNPLKHLDIIGSISMLLVGYGWAKPVPINTRNFRNPKWGMALTGIAGPLSNILLGSLGTCCAAAVAFASVIFGEQIAGNELLGNIVEVLFTFTVNLGIMNFMLAVYNLIPVPPFDGSRFFFAFLPSKWYFAVMKYERYTMIAVIALSFACSRILNFSPFYEVASWMFEILYYSCVSALNIILSLSSILF